MQLYDAFALDTVKPISKKPVFGYENSVVNAAFRVEYVDWNKGKFRFSGGNIADEVFSIVPAISWRPIGQTVLRLNYRYNWQKYLLGNLAAKMAGIQFGFSSYS
jgi:hypothetical protein